MKYLIDTTVFIRSFRGDAQAKDFLINHADSFVSVITVGELLQGVRNDHHKKQINSLIKASNIIWLDQPTQRSSMELLREYSKHGLHLADAFIAASAITYGLKLATDNVKHFSLVKGLKVEAVSW